MSKETVKVDEKKKKEFYIALIIVLIFVAGASYTIAYKLRTAYNVKNYYDELLQDMGNQ